MNNKTPFDSQFVTYVQSADWHDTGDREHAERMLSDWFEGLSEKTKFAIAANSLLLAGESYDNPWLKMLDDADHRVMSTFDYDTGGAHVYIEFSKRA